MRRSGACGIPRIPGRALSAVSAPGDRARSELAPPPRRARRRPAPGQRPRHQRPPGRGGRVAPGRAEPGQPRRHDDGAARGPGRRVGVAARQHVSRPRSLRGEPRSARAAGDRTDPRARARGVGVHRARSRAHDRADGHPRPAARDPGPAARPPARGLRELGRPRVHAHLLARTPRVARGAHGDAPHPAAAGRGSQADPVAADQRGAVRTVLPHQVPRDEAVQPRGLGEPDPGAGPDPRARDAARRDRGRARDGAPRAADDDRVDPAPPGARSVRSLRGRRAGEGDGRGRRQVPPRVLDGSHRRARQQHARLARVQPEPPRGRRSGGRRARAREADPARRLRAPARDGRARPWRRGVRRPGPGRRDAAAVELARLSHRRHRPRDREQPGRVHRLAGRAAVDPVLHRHREDARVSDLARQRRGPRCDRARDRDRVRVPHRVRLGRDHRRLLLPQVRPQRERRAELHAAADVRSDQAEGVAGRGLQQPPDRAGRGDRGRRRRADPATGRRARDRARGREGGEGATARARR